MCWTVVQLPYRLSEYRSQKRELTRLLREKEEEVGEYSFWYVYNHTEPQIPIMCVGEVTGRVESLKKSVRESDREKRIVS